MQFVRGSYTNEDIISALKDFNDKFGYPTSRKLKFSGSDEYPSDYMVVKAFGSVGEACRLAGIEISKKQNTMYNRKEWFKDDLIVVFSVFFDEFMMDSDGIFPTFSDINKCDYLPSSSLFLKHFGSIDNLFNAIGYDRKECELNILKIDLIDEYLYLASILNKTPTSRDIDEYSAKGFCHGAKTFLNNLGSMVEIQEMLGMKLSKSTITKSKTDDELIDELKKLGDEIGRMPGQHDINRSDYCSGVKIYEERFGSMSNALLWAGFQGKKIGKGNIGISKSGKFCRSALEFDFCAELEEKNIKFETEELYNKYIPNLKEKLRFDFSLFIDGEIYFVEIFGLLNKDNYLEKAERKIKLCQENKLKLICLTEKDFYGKIECSPLERVMRTIYDIAQ